MGMLDCRLAQCHWRQVAGAHDGLAELVDAVVYYAH